MTKIITCSELRYRTLAELEAMFRTLQIELGRTAPGSGGRGIMQSLARKVRRAGGGAAVSRTGAVLNGKPVARVQGVSGTAQPGGPLPPACPPADLHRRPGAAGCPPSSSDI